MLKSYEAIYDHGKIEWLSEFPDVEQARVIVTVLPEQPVYSQIPKHRRPTEKLKGTAQILGDIVSSPFLADEPVVWQPEQHGGFLMDEATKTRLSDSQADALLAETAGAWGNRSLPDIDAMLAEQRRQDWGE